MLFQRTIDPSWRSIHNRQFCRVVTFSVWQHRWKRIENVSELLTTQARCSCWLCAVDWTLICARRLDSWHLQVPIGSLRLPLDLLEQGLTRSWPIVHIRRRSSRSEFLSLTPYGTYKAITPVVYSKSRSLLLLPMG